MNTPADIDETILKILRESHEPISTYDMAKRLDISWSTANVHLKDLLLKDLVKSKEEMVKSKRRIVWWIEQRTIGKYLKN